MSKTKVNVINVGTDEKSGTRRCGVLDNTSGMVKTSDGKALEIDYYESIDPNGVGYFQTRKEGKIVQKSGKFEGEG